MNEALTSAVREAVNRARWNGSIMHVLDTAERIAVEQRADDGMVEHIARALIREGVTSGITMAFQRERTVRAA